MFSHGHSHGEQPCSGHGHGGFSLPEGATMVTNTWLPHASASMTPEKLEALQQLYAQGRLILPEQVKVPERHRQGNKTTPVLPNAENSEFFEAIRQINRQQMAPSSQHVTTYHPGEPNEDGSLDKITDSISVDKLLNMWKNKDHEAKTATTGCCKDDGCDKHARQLSMQQTLSSVCHAILTQKPEAVNEKDDDGNTILHRICESGMDQLVMLLLDNNADINSTNNKGQTPIHMACRSGKTMLVHMMKENGADLKAVDQEGWTIMHHAAAGGSVHVIIYLCEVCGLGLQDVNHKKQSLLHVASEHDQQDMVHYLLKNKRSDIHLQDANGNTAMHVACMKGHAQVGWKLLMSGGVKILHVKNKENVDPLDLCARERSSKHFVMMTALNKYYLMQDQMNFKPDRPLRAWYGELLWPHVNFIVTIVLSKVFTPNHQGFLCLFGAAICILQIFDKGHRMSHVSGFPSPSRLGGFVGGFLQSVTCFLLVLSPVVTFLEDGLFNVFIFVCLLPFSIYCFVTMVFGDPGYVTESKQKDNMGGPYTMRDLVVVLSRPQALCVKCELIPSKPTKHCKLCDRCVYEMDHHCLYTTSCIGHRNRRLFVVFTATLLVLQFIFLHSAYQFVYEVEKANGLLDVLLAAFLKHGWVFALSALNFAWSFFGLGVLYGQIWLISKGYTTVFQPLKGSSPCQLSRVQQLLNVFYFFIGRKYRIVKDPMYQV